MSKKEPPAVVDDQYTEIEKAFRKAYLEFIEFEPEGFIIGIVSDEEVYLDFRLNANDATAILNLLKEDFNAAEGEEELTFTPDF